MTTTVDNYSTPKIAIVVSACILSIFLGAAISIQSELTFYALIGIGTLLFFFTFPGQGLIAFLLASFYIPAYTKIDATLIAILLVASVYFLKQKSWEGLNLKKILTPIYLIGILVCISTIAGWFLEANKIEDIYRDGRVFVYWLILIPLAAWAPKEDGAKWLADRMTMIGIAVCILAIAQGVTGKRLVDTGLVADLDTMNTQSMSTVRVQIPGFMFSLYTIGYITALLLGGIKYNYPLKIGPKIITLRIPRRLAFFVLSAGIIYNYGRALWFWTIICLLIVAIQYGYKGFSRLILWASISGILGLGMLAMVKPDMLDTMTARVTSVFDEGGVGSSFGWRELEYQEGLKSLKETFFLGVGMGGKYRRFNEMLINFPDHTIYTHNGLLYLTLKISIFGLLAYLWLGWRVVEALKKKPNKSPDEQAIAAASIAFTIVFLGINFTQPEVMSHYGLLAFVFICAITLFMNKQSRDQSENIDLDSKSKHPGFHDTIPARLASA